MLPIARRSNSDQMLIKPHRPTQNVRLAVGYRDRRRRQLVRGRATRRLELADASIRCFTDARATH